MKNLRGFSSDGKVDLSGADKYNNMNHDQLMNELIASVTAAKNNGTFNPSELDNFLVMMSPHLTPERRRHLKELVEMLKK